MNIEIAERFYIAETELDGREVAAHVEWKLSQGYLYIYDIQVLTRMSDETAIRSGAGRLSETTWLVAAPKLITPTTAKAPLSSVRRRKQKAGRMPT